MEHLDSDGVVPSADGVRIAYTDRGSGSPALVFIHGGLANRGFWHHQVDALSPRYRIVALDLAGHGDSGTDRQKWTITAFAEDVRAVVDHLALARVVLIGNSLGGPVALEAAAMLAGRAIGVIGIDTLQDCTVRSEPDRERVRATQFREDPVGATRQMIDILFHKGAYPELRAWAEAQMLATSPGVIQQMFAGFVGYEMAPPFRNAGVPIRALNGDLFPTAIERNRTLAPDFEAVIMPKTGHYPMLEQPEVFNRLLEDIVAGLG